MFVGQLYRGFHRTGQTLPIAGHQTRRCPEDSTSMGKKEKQMRILSDSSDPHNQTGRVKESASSRLNQIVSHE